MSATDRGLRRRIDQPEYDPVIKRYRATCPACDYFVVRAKREAAKHVLSQHLAYAHGVQL